MKVFSIPLAPVF